MLRVTTLKAAGPAVVELIDYYAGLAEDQQRRDGRSRGPADYYLDPTSRPGGGGEEVVKRSASTARLSPTSSATCSTPATRTPAASWAGASGTSRPGASTRRSRPPNRRRSFGPCPPTGVVERTTSRAGLYVGMTRGRERNVAWVVDDAGTEDPAETLGSIVARPANALTAHAVRDRLRSYRAPQVLDATQRARERLDRRQGRPPSARNLEL